MKSSEVASNFFDWLLHLPQVFANVMTWATQPISDLFPFSPMDILGSSLLAVLGIVLIAKAVHLIVV